jgi:DNA-binding transcriptional LysR family regulator
MRSSESLLPELWLELHTFCEVAELSSFSRAADVLDTTTAAVSRSVKRLEQQLGVRLLNRTTRSVGLTAEGASLLRESRPALRQLQRTLAATRGSRDQLTGRVRVTSTIAFGRRFVAPLVLDFRKQHPSVDIELSLDDRLIDLMDGGYDIAVRGVRAHDAGLIVRELTAVPMYVCASPDLAARFGKPATPEDVLALPCIDYRFRGTGRPMLWQFKRGGRLIQLDIDATLSVDDIDLACAAALDGHGFAQLPGYVAAEHLDRGTLVSVLDEYIDESRRYCIVYANRTEHQPLRDRVFIEYLLDQFLLRYRYLQRASR